jgi:hypothetical protein
LHSEQLLHFSGDGAEPEDLGAWCSDDMEEFEHDRVVGVLIDEFDAEVTP